MIIGFLITVICFANCRPMNTVKAETIGKGERIILYGESGQARFHLGDDVGKSVKLAAEPTGQKTLSDIVFTSNNPSVCSVTSEGDYYLVERLKEGTSVIAMKCKADGELVIPGSAGDMLKKAR